MIDVEYLKRGVTISSVLDEFGYKHRHNRCACFVHGGDNPTAFSFNDQTYYCYTHGCKGDVVTLLQHLLKTDFLGVLAYLARRKGIDLRLSNKRKIRAPLRIPYKPKPARLAAWELAYELCREKIAIFSRRLVNLRSELKKGSISECDFYTQCHKLDNWLEILDLKEATLHFKFRELRNG